MYSKLKLKLIYFLLFCFVFFKILISLVSRQYNFILALDFLKEYHLYLVSIYDKFFTAYFCVISVLVYDNNPDKYMCTNTSGFFNPHIKLKLKQKCSIKKITITGVDRKLAREMVLFITQPLYLLKVCLMNVVHGRN